MGRRVWCGQRFVVSRETADVVKIVGAGGEFCGTQNSPTFHVKQFSGIARKLFQLKRAMNLLLK